jgi:hypothetical protein
VSDGYDAYLDPAPPLDRFFVDGSYSAYEGDVNEDYEEVDECGIQSDLALLSAGEVDLRREYSSSVTGTLKRGYSELGGCDFDEEHGRSGMSLFHRASTAAKN